MNSKYDRRKVGGKKAPEEIRKWMIVVRREAVRSSYRMEVGFVEFAEVIWRLRVEDIAVCIVLENLYAIN